jgi:hypothetical protein
MSKLILIVLSAMLLLSIKAIAEVGDTNVIDVIGTKPNSSEAVLLLNQMRPWNVESRNLLAKKLEFYETVIRTGTLAKQRPDTSGKNFRVIVVYADAPPEDALELLSKTKTRMFENQIILRWGRQQDIAKLVSN